MLRVSPLLMCTCEDLEVGTVLRSISFLHMHLRGPPTPWGPSEGMFSTVLGSGSRSSFLSAGEQSCSQTK